MRVGLDREYLIDLLVELAVAGEAPSSPCRRRRGPWARLYGVASATENWHRGHCRRAGVAAGPASADFEHVASLSLAARGGVTARLCAFDLPLADVREDSAEMLVLDDGCLGNLPQLVEGGVGKPPGRRDAAWRSKNRHPSRVALEETEQAPPELPQKPTTIREEFTRAAGGDSGHGGDAGAAGSSDGGPPPPPTKPRDPSRKRRDRHRDRDDWER